MGSSITGTKGDSTNDDDEANGDPPASDSGAFSEGEKVLAYHGPCIYEAKVQKAEIRENDWSYFVHYLGWNKSWDEWVGVDRLMKFTEENIQKQQELNKQLADKNPRLGRSMQIKPKSSADAKMDKEDLRNYVARGKKRKSESSIEEKDISMEKFVKIQIPSTLKKQLVDDSEFITKLDISPQEDFSFASCMVATEDIVPESAIVDSIEATNKESTPFDDFDARVASFVSDTMQGISRTIVGCTPRSLDKSRLKIEQALNILNFMPSSDDNERQKVEAFISKVRKLFTLNENLLPIKSKVEKGPQVDIEEIQRFKSLRHTCLEQKEQLVEQLGQLNEDMGSHTLNLQSLEPELTEAEARVKSLREKYDFEVQSKGELQKKVEFVTSSIQDYEKYDQDLRQALHEAGEDKLHEHKLITLLKVRLEEKFSRLSQTFST